MTKGKFWLILLFFGCLMVGVGRQSWAEPAPAGVKRLVSTDQQLQFVLNVGQVTVNEQGIVQAAGLNGRLSRPGEPTLPYYTTFIVLPPEATASLAIDQQAPLQWRETIPLQPGPQPAPAVNDSDDLGTLQTLLEHPSYEPLATIYEQDGLYPAGLYTLSEPQYSRDSRLVQLALYPVRYNPRQGQLAIIPQLTVTITFHNGQVSQLRPAESPTWSQSVANLVLNPEKVESWRSLPNALHAPETILPIGSDTFKIEVNQDGIYELSYNDLQAAGMAVGSVNPNTFQMLYRGSNVAYAFVGDSDNSFEAGEAIRFYGWKFDGSRLERQFITNNVFWLWAGGTATRISDTTNPAGNPLASSFRSSVTLEKDLIFYLTRTNQWGAFPNEADAWYMEYIPKTASSPPLETTIPITLPHPAGSGSQATITAEILSRALITHTFDIYLNDATQYTGNLIWANLQNVNVTTNSPAGTLLDGPNTIHLINNTSGNTTTALYWLNRATVDYQRLFVADDNLLVFKNSGGPFTYQVQGFSNNNPANVLVWDITNRQTPANIPNPAISGSNPYTYQFGSNRTGQAAFVVSNSAGVLEPIAITKYVPPSLDPAGDRADWVAISHTNFMAQANQLANHRADADFGSLDTYVVNIKDIIEQYGYGLPIPAAIQNYLAYALANWASPPTYALLLGDSTLNPRALPCDLAIYGQLTCNLWTDPQQTNYVLTDLLFVDRFMGLAPSDHTFALLSGNDLIPDIAIGRLAALDATQAQNMVNKIIQYETNHLSEESWLRRTLFVADNADDGGNFCVENNTVATHLPDSFSDIHLCLPDDPSPEDVAAVRASMSQQVNDLDKGVSILNYRGHGGINDWTNDDLLDSSMTGFWLNDARPVIILSLDCLDGNFAWPGYPALSETFMKLASVGTVAHWSSTGLGYTFEHTIFHAAFFDGPFDVGNSAIGDAIVYAKTIYHQSGNDESEMYTFTLQADPAMLLYREAVEITIYLPAVIKP